MRTYFLTFEVYRGTNKITTGYRTFDADPGRYEIGQLLTDKLEHLKSFYEGDGIIATAFNNVE